MQPKKVFAGTIGYLLIVFPLAYTWHLVLFKNQYETLGYFSRGEPIIAFGFASILLQGILLSIVYPLICPVRSFARGVLTFMALMGVYHWSMHVLAETAKHPIEPLPLWFGLETAYLTIQFGLGGCLFALIYLNQPVVEANAS